MSNHRIRHQLKNEVKQTFKGHWGQASLTALIPIIIQAVAGFIISMVILMSIYLISTHPDIFHPSYWSNLTSGDSTSSEFYKEVTSSNNHSEVWNFVRGALMTFIGVGINYTFLDWLRNPELKFSPVKGAFQVFTKRYFIPALAIFVLQFIFQFLWTLLFIIPGIIKYFSYSQSYLIYKDQLASGNADRIEYVDCITMSRKLMMGHKFEFFTLKLSMIGWYLLCLVSFGIGFIWYIPYSQGVYTAFYKHLVEAS
ncbi:Integral membrane protein [Pediococcus damnosus]|uniref:Integral membrane protein n=1 Tax=Pediococcus damnosus TaxID=51663 RepID=A0A0R2HV49_9LACO|nr:DUF975 family protein [Pediococcus damnosus]AMV62453.1 Integral membrane protein [Pediococcus damnosus]AMV67682.1 Integral membrane protein [Pediococcus damnosus]KJU74427.1 membrane protein [Pediococcus damnosus LMG 28219]KRN53501.1 hypothetical protein IV84_GL000303 [Pediococcus damnosus]PIO80813.1 hypothetical protein BSQ38_03705 [Pediococcus damnosus]